MSRNQIDLQAAGWYIFAGCALIGFGIGVVSGAAFAGLIIGAGVGLLAMVTAPLFLK